MEQVLRSTNEIQADIDRLKSELRKLRYELRLARNRKFRREAGDPAANPVRIAVGKFDDASLGALRDKLSALILACNDERDRLTREGYAPTSPEKLAVYRKKARAAVGYNRVLAEQAKRKQGAPV